MIFRLNHYFGKKRMKIIFIQCVYFSCISLLTACNSGLNNLAFTLVPHPQEPTKRFYEIRDISFTNDMDGTVIAGELTYPYGARNFCAIVLVSGHQINEPPAKRNYEITGHKYFLVLSHLLTQRGYAVLRFDNRGVGESSGTYTNATDSEFSSDATAALHWLRSESGISIVISGFLGHSQGAVKSLLAARDSNPDFIVSLAGMGIETVAEGIIRQNIDINAAMRVDKAVSTQQTHEYRDIFDIIRTASSRENAIEGIIDYMINLSIVDEKKQQKLIEIFGSNWLFNELDRNPHPLIERYQGPILALFGSRDLLVSAKTNEEATRRLLKHPQSRVLTFDGKNHLFQNAIEGTGPHEYWKIRTSIEESVIDTIDIWLRSINACGA